MDHNENSLRGDANAGKVVRIAGCSNRAAAASSQACSVHLMWTAGEAMGGRY